MKTYTYTCYTRPEYRYTMPHREKSIAELIVNQCDVERGGVTVHLETGDVEIPAESFSGITYKDAIGVVNKALGEQDG